ncbi:YhcN/YlaJ family sporulation lipoprotein [Mesobacillus jeotgali]|uniref:YhcN/YlaJ family sporulation lipoprotein n=1 Tax=Mesobacillus jeotgali TaxID=129985 RepID=UPI00177BBC29|nr:YhcN/YlaJ family sporulation lipoprotein [Mesobacillus jeotgali]UYZ22458.1 YhcN/YlaJ family sporulation lipoprotein [Mesobacillus jeotgali]
MKKSIIIAGCAVFTMGLAGCGANNNAADNNRDQQVEISQVRRGPATEGNRLQLADRAERQIEQMPEVDDARVIISENNAYVAVRLADSENEGNAEINGALDGNGRTFTENGRVDQSDNRAGNDGIIDGKGDAGNGDRQNAGNTNRNNVLGNDNNNGNGNMNGIGNTDMNGNAAGNTMNGKNGQLEMQIEQRVRQANNRIDKVYVSVDRDAYNRMGTFADDIRTDRNRDGMFEDFRNAMDGFFGR